MTITNAIHGCVALVPHSHVAMCVITWLLFGTHPF